jgi:hypothetical protein
MSISSGVSYHRTSNHDAHLKDRLPPILVETVSVMLVIHKAVVYFREDNPEESAASRLMLSLVRHSVLYFVV